jgi:hypothetical protein
MMLNKNTNLLTLLPVFAVFLLLMVTKPGSAAQRLDSQGVLLEVTPERCISLHKGQTCYQEVTFTWQHPQANDYCLVNVTRNQVVQCWRQTSTGEASFDFQSTVSNDFALRPKQQNRDLARAQIIVASVYKSSKRSKSSWRLF